MSYHFSMGAINKTTNIYEYPKIANKSNKYKCPCCEKNVIFKNGTILKPHFSHYKSNNPCNYYDKPNETEIHKHAKLLMKSLLDNKQNISIHRKCKYYEQNNHIQKFNDMFDIDYNENTKALIEYKFYYNNSYRKADVALIENDKIKYIFEICYKNKTEEENRPEPWFEINAEDLINKTNSGEIIDHEGNVNINCIRNYKCNFCNEYEENEKIKRNLYNESLKKKLEIERQLKEEETKMRETCKCSIMLKNICKCEIPKYELVKLSNNLFCINCNKWKCRCK